MKPFQYLPKEAFLWGHPTLTPILGADNQDEVCALELLDWLSALYWTASFDRQVRVGLFLREREQTPLPANAVIKLAMQPFFSEYTKRIAAWRLPQILDRDLRSTLKAFDGEADRSFDSILREQKKYLFPYHLARRVVKPCQLAQVRQVIPGIVDEVFFSQTKVPVYQTVESLRQFEELPGYSCVACCPTNELGLHLEPKWDAATETIWDELTFASRTQGFNQIVHGGFVTMALDEILAYAIIMKLKLLPVTKTLNMEFLGPVRVGRKYRVSGKVNSSEGMQHILSGEIVDVETGKACARASAVFIVPNAQIASRLFPDLAKLPQLKDMFHK